MSWGRERGKKNCNNNSENERNRKKMIIIDKKKVGFSFSKKNSL